MFARISGFFYFYFSIIGVYVIFLPKILQTLGYTSAQIGLVFAVAPLTRFIVPFFFQKWFSLTQTVFYVALGSALLSALLFYVTIPYVWFFLVPNVFLGGALGLILPFIETYSLEFLGKERFGKARLFGSVGFMVVGIVLAMLLNDPYMGLHFFLAAVTLMICFGLLVTRKNAHFTTLSSVHGGSIDLKSQLGFWVSLFLMQVSFGAFYNFFTIYQTDHGVSLTITSWMWAFGVICEVGLFYFQGPILKRYGLLGLVQFSTLMTAMRWLLLFLFPGSIAIAFFSQAFHAFSFALHHTAAFSYLHTVYANRRLAAQFYYGFSFGLGGFIGALIAGWMYGPYVYLVSALIAFLGFLTCRFLSR
ncbi:MAG: MFS transporter [Campylobacterales bacterium]|nr:MFS transporter [Campylobacterales bacterium]